MRYDIIISLVALSVLYTSNANPMHDGGSLIAPLLEAKDSDPMFKEKYPSILQSHTHSINTESMDLKSEGVGLTFGFMNTANTETSIQGKVKDVVRDHIYDFRYHPSLESLEIQKKIATQMRHGKNRDLQYLAQMFLDFEDLFVSRTLDWDSQTKKQFIVPCINEALKVLEYRTLKPRERLWLLGILLRIKHFLSKDSGSYLDDFRDGYLVSRGEAELSLLEGQDGAIDAEIKAFSDSLNGDQDTNISDIALSEPLDRIASIYHFKIHIRNNYISYTPTPMMKEIHDEYLSLPVPLKYSDSKQLVEKIKFLISNDRYTDLEKEFTDHIFCHIWRLYGNSEGLKKALFGNPLFLKKENETRTKCHLRCFSQGIKMLSILKPFAKFETLEVDDFNKAISALDHCSMEDGIEILYRLSAASWLREDLAKTFKEFIQSSSRMSLNFAKVLKHRYPHLDLIAPSKENFFHQMFYFNKDLLLSARRVILEDLLLERRIVQQELIDRYRGIKWTFPPSRDPKLNEQINALMEIFQDKIFGNNPDDKLLLFEYIIQVKSCSSSGSAQMQFIIRNKLKDRDAEYQFFKNAEKSTLISGITPFYVKHYLHWVQGQLIDSALQKPLHWIKGLKYQLFPLAR
ncbi:hypothetical protein DFH28DRAFT_979316 [Melampsora americana]|nr:hypothetical protein DFH28DRAFT_979316 [Melampsora americana]